MSYYNTTNLEGDALSEAVAATRTQEEQVLEVFQKHEGELLTPWDVQEELSFSPITSIRRAITDLTRKGELEKTDQKRKGAYETMNYTWRLAS